MPRKGVLLRDPVSDLFTRIRNGYMAKRATITHPYSRLSANVVKVFVQQGYLNDMRIVPPQSLEHAQFDSMEITLRYNNEGVPAIRSLRRVSKPSRRIYRKIDEIPAATGGLGTWILSTPQGVMHCAEARQRRVGGEVLGEVF